LAGRQARRYPSTTIVTGPSLTSSTAMRAPNTPDSTGTPSSRSVSQNRSYEDPEPGDLAGKAVRVVRGVAVCDAEEHDEPLADAADRFGMDTHLRA
jgi:hypothetical protein